MQWDGQERRRYSLDAIGVKIDDIADDIVELKSRVGIQNGRVTKLENWRWFIVGAFAVVGFIIKVAH